MERIVNIIPSVKVICLAFDTKEQFKEWADDLSLYDAKYWINEFEKEEMYEFCVILRDSIEDKEQMTTYLYNGR